MTERATTTTEDPPALALRLRDVARAIVRDDESTHTPVEILTSHPVLTKAETSRVLKVPPSTVENLHRTRQLTGISVGKHLRWKLADIKHFIETLGTDNE